MGEGGGVVVAEASEVFGVSDGCAPTAEASGVFGVSDGCASAVTAAGRVVEVLSSGTGAETGDTMVSSMERGGGFVGNGVEVDLAAISVVAGGGLEDVGTPPGVSSNSSASMVSEDGEEGAIGAEIAVELEVLPNVKKRCKKRYK